MHSKGIVRLAVLACISSGCTHWGTDTQYGAPRATARRPIGAPQVATTSSSSLSAGFAGASASNRSGTRTSMVAGLSGNTDSMTRTHCVQMFEVDYEQSYQTIGKVEGRALDTAGGITLGVIGLGIIATARTDIDVETGARKTDDGAMLFGVGMVAAGLGWIWHAHKNLPKGPPPSSPPQVRNWTASEFGESTGCGMFPGSPYAPSPTAPLAPSPSTPGVLAPAPPPAPPAGSTTDIETRLKKLDELRAHGLITQDEYDAKRKALLDSL